MRKNSRKHSYWKTQLPVDYLDTSLVEDAWETVVADLSGGKPAKLWKILIEQTNNAASAEDLELEITINGTAYTFSRANAASGSIYYGVMTAALTAGDFTPSLSGTGLTVGESSNANRGIAFIADSVGLIRVRQTSNVDATAAQIEVNIVWERLEP